MKNGDWSDLGARSLRVFLAVLDEGSVSVAADRLHMTQSAVSHTLERLRGTLGDPLFLRCGRGIQPTTRAESLREPVRAVLDQLRGLAEPEAFDPHQGPVRFTVAANDFQRDLILPSLLQGAREEGIDLHLRIVPSEVPTAKAVRMPHYDLAVTPFPPEGDDILLKKLFDDRLGCFHDGAVRDAPRTRAELRKRELVTVEFEVHQRPTGLLLDLGKEKLRSRVVVPNFGAMESFIRGTDLIAIEASLMRLATLSRLDCAPLPIREKRGLALYMVWHRRHHADPAHRWLRGRVQQVVRTRLEQAR